MESKLYTVYINNLNYAESPFIRDATRKIEVSEEEYLKIQEISSSQAWLWDEEQQTFILTATPNHEALRFAREIECFNIINRSPLWFNTLSSEQLQELQNWYQAWLDITETGNIPIKPEWLK